MRVTGKYPMVRYVSLCRLAFCLFAASLYSSSRILWPWSRSQFRYLRSDMSQMPSYRFNRARSRRDPLSESRTHRFQSDKIAVEYL